MRKWKANVFLFLLVGLIALGPHPYLQLRDFHRQVNIGAVPLHFTDRFQVEWVHSVELTPWRETYQVNAFSGMELAETSFRSYGAGVPAHFSEQAVRVSVEDGWITVSGLHQQRDKVLYLVTRDDYSLQVREQRWNLASLIPLGTSLELSVEWYPWWYRFTDGLGEKGVTQSFEHTNESAT